MVTFFTALMNENHKRWAKSLLIYLPLGPKLFKEPSSKSNKPIIHNAISHCCLAGKVNEPHKNSILEVSNKI